MTQTKILNQLKALETLYSKGTASPTVETAIQNLIDRKLETALTQHQTLSILLMEATRKTSLLCHPPS